MLQQVLKEHVHYEPSTGLFTRLKYKAGKGFEHINDQGYIIAFLFGKKYRAHHLAWLYVHGVLPKGQIDHINGNRTDNRIENLREVSNQDNLKNSKLYNTNKTGHVGVGLLNGKYRAFITVNYKSYHLGMFGTLEEAIAARVLANAQYNFHKNHGRPNETINTEQ